jgi:seryl-tRNA synthetase
MNPIFNECVCKIQEALNEVEKIDSIAKDPECFINLHFEKNKAHVNWRRNELIADINKYSDQLIQENESNRSQCLQLSAQTNNIARKIDFLKEELFELKKQFDTFDKSSIHLMQDEVRLRFERTKNGAIYIGDRLSEALKDYQESLLIKNELSFGFLDQPVEDIVGKMFDKKQVNKRWNFYYQVQFEAIRALINRI